MSGFFTHIEQETLDNTYFRHVIFTSNHSQLVLMSLKPMEEIGMEVHPDNDQFLRFESGVGKAIIGGEEFTINAGDAVVVPSGTEHNIMNTSATEEMKLYTIYSPAHHPDGTVHKTKEEAMQAESGEK